MEHATEDDRPTVKNLSGPEEGLSVWSFGDCEWVIAHSMEDARTVWKEFTGATEPATEEDVWEKVDPGETMTFWCDAEGKICEVEDGTKLTKTAAEWVAQLGRCYMGSTEW